jgi:hypothetical protein
MNVLRKQFTHEFIDELHYAKGGELTIAKTIVVNAPTNKVLAEVSIIEQEFMKAQLNTMKTFRESVGNETFDKMIDNKPKDKKTDKEDDENTAEGVATMLVSGGADLSKCYFALKTILTVKVAPKSFAYVDETEPMTKEMFDDMTPNETKMILGEYISFFIVASQKV